MSNMQEASLQANWALVSAYRMAPKDAAGNLIKGERKKLMTTFKKTLKQVNRILMLVRHADKEGIKIDLSDHRKLNDGRPSKLTPEIEAALMVRE
jgi:inhibitor of KinA sporulation pathway (predicted exonuclease)